MEFSYSRRNKSLESDLSAEPKEIRKEAIGNGVADSMYRKPEGGPGGTHHAVHPTLPEQHG